MWCALWAWKHANTRIIFWKFCAFATKMSKFSERCKSSEVHGAGGVLVESHYEYQKYRWSLTNVKALSNQLEFLNFFVQSLCCSSYFLHHNSFSSNAYIIISLTITVYHYQHSPCSNYHPSPSCLELRPFAVFYIFRSRQLSHISLLSVLTPTILFWYYR